MRTDTCHSSTTCATNDGTVLTWWWFHCVQIFVWSEEGEEKNERSEEYMGMNWEWGLTQNIPVGINCLRWYRQWQNSISFFYCVMSVLFNRMVAMAQWQWSVSRCGWVLQDVFFKNMFVFRFPSQAMLLHVYSTNSANSKTIIGKIHFSTSQTHHSPSRQFGEIVKIPHKEASTHTYSLVVRL